MINLVNMGKNIALLRKAKGLSQMQAALNSELSIKRWQDIEHGCGNTTTDTLYRIANTLGVPLFVLEALSKKDAEIQSLLSMSPCISLDSIEPQSIGSSILFWRKEKGLSQKELAQRAHVSPARLRDMEHGCANVTINLLNRVAESLGLSLFGIFTFGMEESAVWEIIYEARTAVGMEAA